MEEDCDRCAMFAEVWSQKSSLICGKRYQGEELSEGVGKVINSLRLCKQQRAVVELKVRSNACVYCCVFS